MSIALRSQRVGLIVIPFCLSVCRSFRDLQPTTIDRSQPNLSSDPWKPFWIPVSHTFGAGGKNMQNFAYFQRQPFNAFSCHCERDASCHAHVTCLFAFCSIVFTRWRPYLIVVPRAYARCFFPNGISIGSTVFCGIVSVTQTVQSSAYSNSSHALQRRGHHNRGHSLQEFPLHPQFI